MVKKNVSILGAGAMGWGISWVLSAYQRAKVRLWDRDPEVIAEAKKTGQNLKYSVPEIKLPKEVFLSDDLGETVENSDLTILVVPSFAVREVCQKISNLPLNLPPIVMTSKGMEKETSLLPCQIGREVLGEKTNLLHLAWIGFGKEVYKKIPMDVVLAAKNDSLLAEFKDLFETDWLKVQTSTDLIGGELAGALKNVAGIGIGLANGPKESPELIGKLIKEALKEMIILGKAMGAREETFYTPVGRRDLEISSTPLGRNYSYGIEIYRKGAEEVKKELQERNVTVEGFHTAWASYQLIKKYDLKLPLIEEVYKVIYEKKDPKIIAQKLGNIAL